MIGTFFKLVGKALRFSISRPIQRFNIYNRAKKYLGEDAKYFTPAPRAIGSLSQNSSSQYPHLEGPSGFKSVKQRRLEAIVRRNQRLLEQEETGEDVDQNSDGTNDKKAFSETKQDDRVVIESSTKLPAIRTVSLETSKSSDKLPNAGEAVATRPPRPLPTSTNLQLSDPAVIWQVDQVPPGRLDLNKFQELMINKMADDAYWTAKQISETYNIKEEYAENIIKYFKQVKIILSPRIANKLDYVSRNDPLYKSYKHVIYHVDYSLRDSVDKKFDDTFLPTDDLDPEVRKVLQGSQLQRSPDPKLTSLFKRPQPLRVEPLNRSEATSQIDDEARRRRRLPGASEKKEEESKS